RWRTAMDDRYEHVLERLAAIEEELRDLAYDRLRERAHDPDSEEGRAADADEKKLEQARRAIAKAIGALSPRAAFEGCAPGAGGPHADASKRGAPRGAPLDKLRCGWGQPGADPPAGTVTTHLTGDRGLTGRSRMIRA